MSPHDGRTAADWTRVRNGLSKQSCLRIIVDVRGRSGGAGNRSLPVNFFSLSDPGSDLFFANSAGTPACVPLTPMGRTTVTDFVEPLGPRILIRKDESRHQTRGGIVLPDKAEIPTITGRVVEISAQIERDDDFPVRKYDKVLFHPKNAIQVDIEADNLLFVVPIEDVVAVFRRAKNGRSAKGHQNSQTGEDAPADDSDDPRDS